MVGLAIMSIIFSIGLAIFVKLMRIIDKKYGNEGHEDRG